MLGLWISLTFCLHGVLSQFPRVCTTDGALQTKNCCPRWTDGTPCGFRSGRGRCRNGVAFSSLAAGQVPLYNDDRWDWPRYYYDSTCECYGNYGGFDCGDCKHGYFGERCERRKTLVRREIRELSLVDRRRFFSYLALAKTTKSKDYVVLTTGDRHHRDTFRFVDASIYDVFAWMHYFSMKPIMVNSTLDDSKNFAHQGPVFPGWHRMALMFLEREIQRMTGDEDFAFPYYDWRGEQNCSICTNDFMGDNDVQGNLDPYSHFSNWRGICSGYDYPDAYCPVIQEHQMETILRKPGTDPVAARLPSVQDVEDTLQWRDLDTPPYNETATRSFRNALEGFLRPSDGVTLERNMHNLVHMYLGGTMSRVPISSNDPIFIVHHGFVDKIFDKWIQKYNISPSLYPPNDEPGQGPNECCTPYFPCIRNKDLLWKSTQFGYRYSYYKNF